MLALLSFYSFKRANATGPTCLTVTTTAGHAYFELQHPD